MPLNAEVVITPTDPRANDAAQARADAVRKVLFQASARRPNLLGEVSRYVRLGELSYWTFMASWAVLLAGMIGVVVEVPGGPPSIPAMVKSVLTLLGNIVSLQIAELYETFTALVASRWRITVVVAVTGFLIAWRLSASADKWMSAVFSQFWHQQQPALRAALKGTRQRP